MRSFNFLVKALREVGLNLLLESLVAFGIGHTKKGYVLFSCVIMMFTFLVMDSSIQCDSVNV